MATPGAVATGDGHDDVQAEGSVQTRYVVVAMVRPWPGTFSNRHASSRHSSELIDGCESWTRGAGLVEGGNYTNKLDTQQHVHAG